MSPSSKTPQDSYEHLTLFFFTDCIEGFLKLIHTCIFYTHVLLCTKDLDVSFSPSIIAMDCHKDQIQSISWKSDGACIVTSCKDKLLRILDPRSGNVEQVLY